MGKVIVWKKEELDFISENYLDMSYSQIGEIIGRSKKAVLVKASKMGLRKEPKNKFNQDIFSRIDSEEKAYWLGFIFADGYVTKNKLNSSLGIEIKYSDKQHLKKFNQFIDGNIEVKDRIRIVGKNQTECKMSSFRLYSKKLVNDLIEKGVTPKKSFTIKFPNIEKEFLFDFIRGYFDGDGSISVEKRSKQLRCNFTTGSLDFVNSIKNIFEKHDIKCYISNHSGKYFQLTISSKSSTKKFLNIIYEKASVYLDRKFNFYKKNIDLLEYIREGWNK